MEINTEPVQFSLSFEELRTIYAAKCKDVKQTPLASLERYFVKC